MTKLAGTSALKTIWRPVYGPRAAVILSLIFIALLAPVKHDSAISKNSSAKTTSGLNSVRYIYGPDKKIIGGWLPFWDINEGLKTLDEFPLAFTEISPFWYKIAPDGRIANSPRAEDQETFKTIKSHNKLIIPTIIGSDRGLVSGILNDDSIRHLHINEILAKIDDYNYDGIDIDYESLDASDRDSFSKFIQELSGPVRERGKLLVVTVNAKTSKPGDWGGAQSHDYRALGDSADFIRVMAYDQHYADGPPGPIAAIDWVEKVVVFALSKIPKEKIVLGVPVYGYDWPSGGRAKSVVYDEVAAISKDKQIPAGWDVRSASPFLNYSDEKGGRQIWFENGRSLKAKFDLVKHFDLAGVIVWRLGREDKSIYMKLPTSYLSQ